MIADLYIYRFAKGREISQHETSRCLLEYQLSDDLGVGGFVELSARPLERFHGWRFQR